MRRTAFLLGMASALVAVHPAAGQLALGARVGTTGLGGQVAYGLGERFALRGSVGFIPIKPTFTANTGSNPIEYEAEPPSPIFTAGADFYLTGGIRLFGGLLIGADELTVSGPYQQTVTFGNRTYTGSGDVTATVSAKSTAPFVGIGFGKTVGSGVGLFLDLGAGFVGDPDVRLDATGSVRQAPDYEQQRQAEEQKIQEKIDKYFKAYPIINLGVRIGVGG